MKSSQRPSLRSQAMLVLVCLLALMLVASNSLAQSSPSAAQSPASAGSSAPDAPALLLNFQGLLLDPATGNPKPNGDYEIGFAIYDSDIAGTRLWSEIRTVSVLNGLYTVLLGQIEYIDPDIFMGEPRWVGVAVSPDAEATPRIQIAHVPQAIYATNAGNSSRLGGVSASSYTQVGHTHDAAAVATGTLNTDRYSARVDLANEGHLANAAGDLAQNNGVLQSTLNADLLDGMHLSGIDATYVNTTGDTMNGTLNVIIPAGGSHGVSANTASTASGAAAVEAKNTGAGYGLNASSATSYGVLAVASGSNPSVYGYNNGPSGSAGYGVYGQSIYQYGVRAASSNNWGLYASGGDIGAYGYGVTYGLYGYNTSAVSLAAGVGGYASAATGSVAGVKGQCNSSNASCYGGYFLGRVHVTGNLSVGGTKPFRIDHPLDPANKYLYHFAVESPEVRNLYQGNAVLDNKGEAVVTLPEYFDALNADTQFNYQLTCIGGYAQVYIAEKISGNQFKIAGGRSGLEVSWQVTAIRDDPYLRDHPVQAEVDKDADERGTLQYPEGYGQPKTMAVDKLQAPAPLENTGSPTP